MTLHIFDSGPGNFSGSARIETRSWRDGFDPRRFAITDTLVAANSNTLSYSPANRLAAANGAWGNASYTYDGAGN